MTRLDEKQFALIKSWIGLADQPGMDVYMRFMALWISFNAYCYAHHALAAQRERADIRKFRGLQMLTDTERPVAGTIQSTNNRITIDIAAPSIIKILIADKYTEDHIYSAFAERHADTYGSLLNDDSFRDRLVRLQHALEKRAGEYYVINMIKAEQHEDNGDLRDMEGRNVIVRFTDMASLRQLKDVLYQIRSNIFHGEKAPGVVNDDRIVTAASPSWDNSCMHSSHKRSNE
jgi:hypothetical protein